MSPRSDLDTRLQRLLTYVDADPSNLSLIEEAATVAETCGQPDRAQTLLAPHLVNPALPDSARVTAALAALQLEQWPPARALLEEVHARHPTDPAIRFNLAWCQAAQKETSSALALLDDHTLDTLPQACALQVQLLHAADKLDEALAAAKRHAHRHPEAPGLAAVISTLALDMEDLELAASSASRAGDLPEALVTKAMLALSADHNVAARDLFEAAVARSPHSARGRVGLGLAKLSQGLADEASDDLERGAAMFEDHPGSWLAAGWSHLIAKRLAQARACFETALRIDPNFCEPHGSLAVASILEGDDPSAKRLMATAFRLDRQCFSASLAQVLLLRQNSAHADADALFEKALTTPIGASQRTIAQSLVQLGFRKS